MRLGRRGEIKAHAGQSGFLLLGNGMDTFVTRMGSVAQRQRAHST